MFHRNVGLSSQYTALKARRPYSSPEIFAGARKILRGIVKQKRNTHATSPYVLERFSKQIS
jgi:hypothetical protein